MITQMRALPVEVHPMDEVEKLVPLHVAADFLQQSFHPLRPQLATASLQVMR
jgi:hypothetical protein